MSMITQQKKPLGFLLDSIQLRSAQVHERNVSDGPYETK